MNEFNFGLKQKFNIKCLLDLIVFIIACILFVLFAKLNHAAPYDTLVFLIIVILLNFSVHFVTKQWISKSIRQAMTVQSNSLAETTSEFMETVNTQKRMFEDLAGNTKTISSLIEKLKGLSEDIVFVLPARSSNIRFWVLTVSINSDVVSASEFD